VETRSSHGVAVDDVPKRCFIEGDTEYCLPPVLGVCCVRSGTTSLASYLNAHPGASYGVKKEHLFFRFISGVGPWAGARQLHIPQGLSFDPENLRVPFQFGGDHWDMVSMNFTTVSTDLMFRTGFFLRDHPVFLRQQIASDGDWKTYARQFPATVSDSTSSVVRFDFDPTYMSGLGSLASARTILHLLGPSTKLLFVFRSPFHQACARLGARADADKCWGSVSSIDCSQQDQCTRNLRALGRRGDSGCADVWLLQLHNLCYVEHIEGWLAAGFQLDRMFFVQSEELHHGNTRAALVRRVLTFMGVDPNLDGVNLLRFQETLQAEYNTHSTHSKAGRPSSMGHGQSESAAKTCESALSRSGSFLDSCNARLADLLQDKKWRWAS